MIKILRSYCLVSVIILCITVFSCGIIQSSVNTQTTAFGTEQTVVAAARREHGLDIDLNNVVLRIEPKMSLAQTAEILSLFPFPVGNIVCISSCIYELFYVVS